MKDKFFVLGFFVFLIVSLNIAYTSLLNISVNEEKTRYKYIAKNEANYISNCIDKVVVRTYTIREMIIENDGAIDFFDKVSDNILQSIKFDTGISLRNIAVAPNGIIKKVSPLNHNEALIGFDFTDESKSGNKESMESYKKEQTIITNPFPLMQGGLGMAGRTPVFINNEEKREFWGLVTATMDFSDVLNSFNFANFNKMQIQYCLWYENENGEKVVLDENYESNLTDAVCEELRVFNLKWHLDVAPRNGWFDKNMQILARLAIVVISLLLSLLVLLMFRIKKDGILMRNLAEKDSLTHCYSRHYLNSKIIDVQTGNWKKTQESYTVAIVDVDKFKQINDTYGHIIGDRALISIAKVLQESVFDSKKDKIVRFGGDEFLVFYNEKVERKDLRIKFQEILSGIEAIRFDDIPELKLGVSIGVGFAEFAKSSNYSDLMKRADDNLYKVKENGRNNYVME